MRGWRTLLCAGWLAMASPALADEPVAAQKTRLLRETAETTTVVDALDDDDPFDANLLLTFRQSWKSASIRRESTLTQPGLADGAFTPSNENVASYSHSRSILEVGGEVGLWKDLALSLRLPIILADARELEELDGSTRNPERFQDPTGAALFGLPFKSPTRSGIDWLGVGLNYAITNQQRDASKPTWVAGVEGRLALGPRMHACNDGAAIECPDPANPAVSRDPGISRGMHALVAQTILSRRWGYVEPYFGFKALVEFPQSNSDFGRTNDFRGSLLNRPPVVGTFTIGTEIFPFERREQFRRLSVDVRAHASYHSPGRDYSELFDALGSSSAPSLRNPNPGGYRAEGNASVVDPGAPKVYFSGVTDQQAFGVFGFATGATFQLNAYLKFNAGLGLSFVQSHLITAADACNPDFKGDTGASGPCRTGSATASGGSVTGIPNPNHRQVIDLPGRRFSVDDITIVDLWLGTAVMF